MLKELDLPTLQTRRQQQRLIFFFKVVEGQIPALPAEDFIKSHKPKRQIRAKAYKDHETTNIIDKQVRNNSKAVVVPAVKTDQYKNSFFIKTAIDWNHIKDNTVCAKTMEGFKSALLAKRD